METPSEPVKTTELIAKLPTPSLSVIEMQESTKSRAVVYLVALNTEYPNEFTNDFDSFSMVASASFEDTYGSVMPSSDQSYVDLRSLVILNTQNKAFHDYVERRKTFIERSTK